MKKVLVFVLVAFVVVLTSCLLFKEPILTKIGNMLVYEDVLSPVDGILILSGDTNSGNRALSGINLYKKGLAKYLIFSHEKGFYGSSHDFVREFFIQSGVLEKNIIMDTIRGEMSTWGEGITNLNLMKSHGIKSFILVTSDFHTQRAHSVYKQLIKESGYDIKFLVHPSPDPKTPLKEWWKYRRSKIMVFLEYTKALNYFIEHKL